MTTPREFAAWREPSSRTYLIVGWAAAAIIALALLERDVGVWALVPPAVGAAALAFQWSGAPVFVVLGVVIGIMISQQFGAIQDPLADGVLAAGVLTFVMAHYRLLSLKQSIFPHDPRRILGPARPRTQGLPAVVELLMAITIIPFLIYHRRKRKQTPKKPKQKPNLEPRNCGSFAEDEVIRALAVIALAATLAVSLWRFSERWSPPFAIIANQWYLGVMGWSFCAAVASIWLLVGYLSMRRWTAEEARLALNDELWRQTRREQRSVSRWTAWARQQHRRSIP